jgi:hypothetical protein
LCQEVLNFIIHSFLRVYHAGLQFRAF